MGGGNNQKAIYVRHAFIPTFIELFSPYIHSSMLYKLLTKWAFWCSSLCDAYCDSIRFFL